MTTKKLQMQRVIRLYKQQTGKTEVDMHKVAEYAVTRLGMVLPTVKGPLEILLSSFLKLPEMKSGTTKLL